DIKVLADLNKREIPAATIGWELPGTHLSSVMVDNEAGGRLALEHLYQLGHRRIAVIRGPKRLIDSAPRWRGIQKFAQSVKLKLDSSLELQLPDVFDPNSSFEHGFRLTEELLRDKKKFTALLAFDDITALGAIRALAHHGAPAARNDGQRCREYRHGSDQGRARKPRLVRRLSEASSRVGDAG